MTPDLLNQVAACKAAAEKGISHQRQLHWRQSDKEDREDRMRFVLDVSMIQGSVGSSLISRDRHGCDRR